MRLTNIAILTIRGSRGINKKLSKVLDVSVSTINRYIADNSDNLTKAAALEVIKQELGLTEDQILEREPATAA
ncbi:MAG: hypothetical protein KF862_07330 [Chitinophagaceae bacterium]|nr:hypothetical protein [Chitinophagaceae bacterium]